MKSLSPDSMRPIMRLILSALAIFILSTRVYGTVTVCASGCNTTSITSAVATATATPNSVIQLNDSSITNEAVTIGALANVNTSLTFQAINNCVWAATGADANFTIGAALTSPVTLKNMTMTHSGTAGAVATWSGIGVGASLFMQKLTIRQLTDSTAVNELVTLVSGSQFVVDKCDFYGPSLTGSNVLLNVAGASIFAGSSLIKNSSFTCVAGGGRGITSADTSATATVGIYYCTISGAAIGLRAVGGFDMKNCILINNTADDTLTSPAVITMAVNCGFGQRASGATTSIYGLTNANTFSDRNFFNYFLGPQATCRGAGVSINGITQVDVANNGVITGLDIGARPYSLALCGGYQDGH